MIFVDYTAKKGHTSIRRPSDWLSTTVLKSDEWLNGVERTDDGYRGDKVEPDKVGDIRDGEPPGT